jgi:hypothetical protein
LRRSTAGPQWTIGADGTIGALGKCLDVTKSGTTNSAKVHLYDCNGINTQKWAPSACNDLVSPWADKCLDVTGVNSADGTLLRIWECTRASNQKWSIPA